MLLMGKEGESRARRRLPGSDAVRPRHRRWSCVQSEAASLAREVRRCRKGADRGVG